ncbi:MAG: ORF2 [Hainan mamastrovirus]|nr:MAG: ORF2 [Hainan mamastrovirus]
MANRQQKRQPPRNTTNIVVRNGSSSNQAGPSRASQARRRRNRRRPQQTVVRVLPNKNQGRRRNPRVQGIGNRVVVQKIVTTLGTVGSNGSGSIETELAILLNPCTMKDTTGSNTYGPVQIYASTYSLFSIRSLKLHLKPLVGQSAVSGTVIRTSWNPTSTPSQMSWSALGARKHSDTTPGREGKFILTAKDLKGPKDGWYKTNTKGDPMLSFAGSLEIHTYGETMRTYQSGRFEGGLFLAELEVVWAFKDYAQQPGLVNLLKGDSTGETKVLTDNEGRLILETPAQSELARAARTTTTASEIIWMVTDAVVNAATQFFPPPFSWLLKGGWWFLKKIGGAPSRTGATRFMIYASINDARADVPCVSTQTGAAPINVGQLHFQQITPGNTGIGIDVPATRAIDYSSVRVMVTNATMLKLSTEDTIPSACVWYNFNGGQNHGRGLGLRVGSTNVATFNIHQVTPTTDVGPVEPQMFTHQVPIKFFNDKNLDGEVVGYAVASAYQQIDGENSLWVSSILFHANNSKTHVISGNWFTTLVKYPNNDYQVDVQTVHRSNQNYTIKVQAGHWYVLQYAIQGTINGKYYVGDDVVAVRAERNIQQVAQNWSFAPQASLATSGLMPAFINGLQLTPLTTNEVILRTDRISDQHAGTQYFGEAAIGNPTCSELHPSFGCDDALEFPPPPSEEDLTDEACGFEPFSDSEAEDFEDPEEDEDEELELGPDDDYSDPPISRLVVVPEAQQLYEQLRANFSEREARLAVNQLNPSGEYAQFTAAYHNALVDGLSPRDARAFALGL